MLDHSFIEFITNLELDNNENCRKTKNCKSLNEIFLKSATNFFSRKCTLTLKTLLKRLKSSLHSLYASRVSLINLR